MGDAPDEVTGPPKVTPVWQWCGGAEVVDPAVDEMLFRMRLDSELARWFTRGGGCPRDRLRLFIVTAMGGPGEWDGPLLESLHQPLGIADEQFSRFGGCLLHALSAHGVPSGVLAMVVEVFEPLRAHIVRQEDGPGS